MFFRISDVVVAGDILDTTRFPVIDVEKGGSVQGEIDALNHVIELAISPIPFIYQEGGTYVIPGHGRICDQLDVVEYRDMIVTRPGRDRRHDKTRNDAGADQGCRSGETV